MKKIAIVLFVVATALAACGKKKAENTTPTGDQGSATTEPAGSGSDAGSASGSGK
jgi:hypothetical protein